MAWGIPGRFISARHWVGDFNQARQGLAVRSGCVSWFSLQARQSPTCCQVTYTIVLYVEAFGPSAEIANPVHGYRRNTDNVRTRFRSADCSHSPSHHVLMAVGGEPGGRRSNRRR